MRIKAFGISIVLFSCFAISAGGQGMWNITIGNDDPFGNNVVVRDRNAGDSIIWQGYIDAHKEITVPCQRNDADYCNLSTFQDNNPGVGRSFLKDGDRITL